MAEILFLAHRVPFPPDRGDKIRAFHVLDHLARRHRVHLAAFADSDADAGAEEGLAPLTIGRAIVRRTKSRPSALIEALAGGHPVSLAAFADPRMARAVHAILAAHPIDTIYVYSSQMAQYLPPTPMARVLIDFVDVDSAKFADYAARAHGPMRWLYRREARLLLDHDRAAAARADASLFVSAEEAALFRHLTGAERVHAVENGIDTARFDPRAAFERVSPAQPTIVFTGQMDYPPNVEAAHWFAEAILPLVRARHAEARFAIVGRHPTRAVEALARRPGVTVTGAVADVRGWLAAAAVAVAPLKLARGVQNKVLEAMAMARPVVASPAAAEGIDHGGTIRVGATPQRIAAEICALLDDRREAEALGAAARARVQQRYGWTARLAALDALLEAPLRSAA